MKKQYESAPMLTITSCEDIVRTSIGNEPKDNLGYWNNGWFASKGGNE